MKSMDEYGRYGYMDEWYDYGMKSMSPARRGGVVYFRIMLHPLLVAFMWLVLSFTDNLKKFQGK